MQQGKPLGLAKNTRSGICPAGRERTFGGMPTGQAASEGTTKTILGRGYINNFWAGGVRSYCFFLIYASARVFFAK